LVSGQTERARHEVARVASDAGALAAVCAIHLESGERIELNSEDPFPLASTYKLPIAIRLLKLVEEGGLSWEQMIEVREEDLTPGSGLIKDFFTIPGLQLSIRNLLGLTFQFSDNTASDIVLGLAGGAHDVTNMVRSAGIDAIRIDRSAKQILFLWPIRAGIPQTLVAEGFSSAIEGNECGIARSGTGSLSARSPRPRLGVGDRLSPDEVVQRGAPESAAYESADGPDAKMPDRAEATEGSAPSRNNGRAQDGHY
jgi:hypothetical protein